MIPAWTRKLKSGLFPLLVLSGGCTGRQHDAEFVRRIEWIGNGTWLKADLHIHSRFSDGHYDVAKIVGKAKKHGCDVIAITDHSDHDLSGASEGYFAATAAARQENPDLIIIDGIEWNVPPGAGDDHAGVLVPPGPEGVQALKEFKTRFDDLGREIHDEELAHEAFRWLADQSTSWSVPPVVIFNHPNRRVDKSLDNLGKLRRFRKGTQLLIGIEGSPGHQGATPLGSYAGPEQTLDRWDPAAARIGDLWDQLLAGGEEWWGAAAFSDFHDEPDDGLRDYWPGQFSETWLYVPERTAEGVLNALRAGCFFADHAAIVREVKLTVQAQGLARPAWVGEYIMVGESARVTARVEMSVPERDWAGESNRIDLVELIAVDSGGSRVVAARPPDRGLVALEESLPVPQGGLVLRARGRRVVAGGPGYCFYTNSVRIAVRQ